MAQKISTRELKKTYGARTVVNLVSIQIQKGEIIGLLGPNGAGKTTTFYMVVGLIKPDKGQVLLDDKDITQLPMHKRARLGIGYLPQEASIFRRMTVEDNLIALWELRKNVPRSEYKKKSKELLEEMGIEHLRKSLGYELSGGEKRRVEIARALALDPEFLLLDEPFAGIDPIAVHEIQQIVRNLAAKGLGIMITDHNVRETLAITNRAYIIHKGELLFSGNAEEIINSELAKRFYLGEGFHL